MENQKTILIVEDEESLRKVIVDLLRLKNFLPLEAKNGGEGVELALSKHPDLILLDLILPELGGMAVLKRIRQDAWGAQVPVIILTNLSATNEELVNDMVAFKPAFYLVKSAWDIHDVVCKVEEILNTKN